MNLLNIPASMRPETGNPATRETCQFDIWKHEVYTAASLPVDSADTSRLLLWYRTGEPVWMAARALRDMSRRPVVASPREHLRAAMQASQQALARKVAP